VRLIIRCDDEDRGWDAPGKPLGGTTAVSTGGRFHQEGLPSGHERDVPDDPPTVAFSRPLEAVIAVEGRAGGPSSLPKTHAGPERDPADGDVIVVFEVVVLEFGKAGQSLPAVDVERRPESETGHGRRAVREGDGSISGQALGGVGGGVIGRGGGGGLLRRPLLLRERSNDAHPAAAAAAVVVGRGAWRGGSGRQVGGARDANGQQPRESPRDVVRDAARRWR
jgi:hypothetical protein